MTKYRNYSATFETDAVNEPVKLGASDLARAINEPVYGRDIGRTTAINEPVVLPALEERVAVRKPISPRRVRAPEF